MSSTRNFRISINLCQWFNDHRHIARIFINDDINIIGDLEKRIENIFKIKNFHLTCRNEYLPSSEDVRILQKDDVVWVMQNNYEEENTSKTSSVAISSTENVFKGNKRVSVPEEETELDSHPVKKKKKKKHKLEEIEDEGPKKKKKLKDNRNYTTKDEVSSEEFKHKHKKIKKSLSSTSDDHITSNAVEKESGTSENSSLNITKLLPVLQSHIDSYNKKNSSKLNETSNSLGASPNSVQTVDQSHLSNNTKETYKCKGNLSSYKRRMTVPTITDKYLQQKKINIVKIEYLSRVPPVFKEGESTKKNENHEALDSPRNTDFNAAPTAFVDKVNSCDSGIQIRQNTAKLENSFPILDKSNISCSFPDPAEEKMEVCSSEAQIDNNSVNNVSSEVTETSKSFVTKFNETLVLDQPVEVQESNQGTVVKGFPFQTRLDENNPRYDSLIDLSSKSQISPETSNCGKENKFSDDTSEIFNTSYKLVSHLNNSMDVTKSVLSSNSIDLSSKEKDISYQINPETSKNCDKKFPENVSEILSASYKLTSCLNKSMNVTESFLASNVDPIPKTASEASKKYVEGDLPSEKNTIESDGYNANLEKPDSDYDQSVNMMDSSKNLQMLDASDLNCTNKTDQLNENVCRISQKDSSKDVNETTMDLSESKQSDVTEDILDSSTVTRGNGSFRRRKQLAGLGQLLGELRSTESLVTGESMDSDYSEFVTKRKRKRVRKRKKKNNEDNLLDDSSIIADPVPKPLRTRACPNQHLKFAEEDGETVKVIDVTKRETGDAESYMDTSGIENITIDSDADQSQAENFNIKEEYILKSPYIKYLMPKVGDIIAFKILRITENYTPEVSSYIVGKVLDFNDDTKVVLCEILNGLEQCKNPTGVLSLDEADKNNETNKREFAWSDIIDPRLLFP